MVALRLALPVLLLLPRTCGPATEKKSVPGLPLRSWPTSCWALKLCARPAATRPSEFWVCCRVWRNARAAPIDPPLTLAGGEGLECAADHDADGQLAGIGGVGLRGERGLLTAQNQGLAVAEEKTLVPPSAVGTTDMRACLAMSCSSASRWSIRSRSAAGRRRGGDDDLPVELRQLGGVGIHRAHRLRDRGIGLVAETRRAGPTGC